MRQFLALPLLLLVSLCPSCRMFGKPKSVRVERPQTTTAGGVRWRDVLVGTGEPAREGDCLTIEYVARLSDGTKVDATADRGLPFQFVLGAAPVPGWNEGLAGMRTGGVRALDVPPELAYGPEGIPGLVPADSPMSFEVELVGIE